MRSMIFAGQSVLNCTIWEYVFLIFFLQIISLFVIVLVIVVMSALLKDTTLTIIWGMVIFIGPLFMEGSGLYKIHFLEYECTARCAPVITGQMGYDCFTSVNLGDLSSSCKLLHSL